MSRRCRPPRSALALLERAVPSLQARQGILGDLQEEYLDRLRRHSVLRSDLWFWRQAWFISLRYFAERALNPSVKTRRGGEESVMRDWIGDCRYAFRTLLKSPGFAFVVILTAALGIGANTAVFSVFNAALIQSLPFQSAQRLTAIFNLSPRGNRDSISPADFLDWKGRNSVFQHLAAFHSETFNLTRIGEPLRLSGQMVSAEIFPLLGVPPLLGRTFTSAEDQPGSPATAILSYGVGLLFRSFSYLSGLTPGFRAERVLTLRMEPPLTKYPADERRWSFYREVVEKVLALPGVEAADFTAGLPFTLSGGSLGFAPEGYQPTSDEPIFATYRGIGPDYLQCMQIPVLLGRYFQPGDFEPDRNVVIVNQSLAERYWPGEDPVGKRLKLFGPNSSAPWSQIVAVVGNVRRYQMAADPPDAFYAPYTQVPIPFFLPRHLAVRTADPPLQSASSIREVIRQVDGDLPVYDIAPMSEIVARSISQPRSALMLFGVLAGLSCFLAILGVYGVVSYAVKLRARELGIRIALGARRLEIVKQALAGGLRSAAVGLAAGLALAYGLTRFLAEWLHGVGPTDSLTYLATASLLAGVVATACLFPSLRASRLDPVSVLRKE